MESLFDKVADHEACNFIKKRFQQMCFLVNTAKFLKTAILKNTCERQFLWISESLFKVKFSTLFRTTFTLWKTPVGRQLHAMCFRSKGTFLITLFCFMINFLAILCFVAISCVWRNGIGTLRRLEKKQASGCFFRMVVLYGSRSNGYFIEDSLI